MSRARVAFLCPRGPRASWRAGLLQPPVALPPGSDTTPAGGQLDLCPGVHEPRIRLPVVRTGARRFHRPRSQLRQGPASLSGTHATLLTSRVAHSTRMPISIAPVRPALAKDGLKV